jgi:hypothetical protein
MDEMTLISMKNCFIEKHLKYDRICKKVSGMCLQFEPKYLSLGYMTMGGSSASLVNAQWMGTLGTNILIQTAIYDRYCKSPPFPPFCHS